MKNTIWKLLFVLVLGAAPGVSWAQHIHTSSLPTTRATIDKDVQDFVYLEGERVEEGGGHSVGDPRDKVRTVFRSEPTADAWGAFDLKDAGEVSPGAMYANRGGLATDYPKVNVYWTDVLAKSGERLNPGLYDAYIRAQVPGGVQGRQTFTLYVAVDREMLYAAGAKGVGSVVADSKQAAWYKIARFTLLSGQRSFRLKIDTKQSPANFDTVLLVQVVK